jgi:hypothetical protein
MNIISIFIFLLVTLLSMLMDRRVFQSSRKPYVFLYVGLICFSWIFILSPWREIEHFLPTQVFIEYISPHIMQWVGL